MPILSLQKNIIEIKYINGNANPIDIITKNKAYNTLI